MVLRGSKTAPQKDLYELHEAIAKAKKYVQETETEEMKISDDITKYIQTELITNPEEKQLSKELTDTIKVLLHNLEYYEELHQQAQSSYFQLTEEWHLGLQQLLCGGIAGAISRSTVAPIDRIKLLIQTAKARNTQAKSMLMTATTEIAKNGIFSLWKGNFTNCVRVFPYAAIQFATYERFKHIVEQASENYFHHEFGVFERLASGALAGATAATLTYPLDVIRVRQACFNEIKGPLEASHLLYKEGGLIAFYRGWQPTVLSLGPFIAINFASFDYLKSVFIPDGDTKKASSLLVLGLGAGAGLFAQTICYPLDTIRRNMQMPGNSYTSVPMAWKTTYKTDGVLGFYRGMIPNAIKIVPNNAIRFLVYSKLTAYLGIKPRQKGEGGGFGG